MAFSNGQIVQAADLDAANDKLIKGGAGPIGVVSASTTAVALTGTSISVTIPTGGSAKFTIVEPDIGYTTAGFLAVNIRLRRNGVALGGSNNSANFLELANLRLSAVAVTTDSPGAGTYTYDLDRICASNSGTYQMYSGAYIIAEVYGPA